MIGLDTNVLVRYLAQDDREQARRATDLMERRLSIDEPGFISVVAMVETAWVLERAYGRNDRDVAGAIELLLQAETLVVECEQEVFAAASALKDGRGAFADALIGALGSRAGCTTTATFSRKAARLAGFELLS